MKTIVIIFLVIFGFLILLISLAGWMFDKKTTDQMSLVLSQTDDTPATELASTPESICFSDTTLSDLPPPVRYWLIASGAVSHESVKSVELIQKGVHPGRYGFISANREMSFK